MYKYDFLYINILLLFSAIMTHSVDDDKIALHSADDIDPTRIQFNIIDFQREISEYGPVGPLLGTYTMSDLTIPRLRSILNGCYMNGIRDICIYDSGYNAHTLLIIRILQRSEYLYYTMQNPQHEIGQFSRYVYYFREYIRGATRLHTDIITPYMQKTIKSLMQIYEQNET